MPKDKARSYHEIVFAEFLTLFTFWPLAMIAAIVIGHGLSVFDGLAIAGVATLVTVVRYRRLKSERMKIVNHYCDPFEVD